MPRPVRIALVLLGGWIAACELHGLGLTWVPTGPEKWLHLVVMAAGGALCVARGAIHRAERGAWLLLGAGVMAWVLGELYFTVVLWSDASPPVPSPADAGYLSLPPLVFAGLVILARTRIRGLSTSLWADGLIGGLTASALSAAVVLQPVVNALGGSELAIATNLSYPIADLLLLALISGLLAAGGRRLDRRFAILALGIFCFWASDTIYLIQSAHGTWISGGAVDPGWWAISVCFAAAAWTPARGRVAEFRPRPLISIPTVFALISLGILIAGSLASITFVAVLLAAGALVCVLGRLVLTFREHQAMLDRSRDEAITDPLTGLGNRRALAGALQRRLESERPAPMILALFDLDGFKSYNDRFGHAAGDALLQRLAMGLRAVLAAPAGVYRMGGDEFCAVLPAGDEGQALLRAASAVLTESGDGFSISASVGWVALPEETDDVGEALRLADQRMYAHKNGVRRAGAADEVKRALLTALEQRDPELSGHVTDVAVLAERTARAMGASDRLVEQVRVAAELHDIGKMAIPEEILNKPGALTDQEWALMRQHTMAGERIIAVSPALADVAPLVRSSHERWDGGGYPDGLSGMEIPAGAQIISVCDSYHAMTSDRSYRRAMSSDVALAELHAGAGSQFDPAVVAAFVAVHAGAADAQRPDPQAPAQDKGRRQTPAVRSATVKPSDS